MVTHQLKAANKSTFRPSIFHIFFNPLRTFSIKNKKITPNIGGKKPSVLGFCIGAVVGLVAITPGAGFVGIAHSAFIGFIAAIISNLAVS